MFIGGAFLIILVIGVAALYSGQSVTGNVIKQDFSALEVKGSDTLLQLVSNMAEAYSEQDSATRISVTGGGSGTGIASLINGEVGIADSSRSIKDSEVSLAKDQGIDIMEVRVARDMLSVITNEDNTIKQLSKDEIGQIYRGEITNWKDVGGEDNPITLYGRQSTSGTYAFFLEEVVEGEYSPTMRNLEGNQAILEAVRQDKTGIGYVGLGYIVDESGNQVEGIHVLEVSDSPGSQAISPLDKSTMDKYPISRPLFQYLANKPNPGTPLYDFIKFELSERGQEIVEETGFVKLFPQDRAANSEKLGM
jgi:phosphate transport system substrate-binding protein